MSPKYASSQLVCESYIICQTQDLRILNITIKTFRFPERLAFWLTSEITIKRYLGNSWHLPFFKFLLNMDPRLAVTPHWIFYRILYILFWVNFRKSILFHFGWVSFGFHSGKIRKPCMFMIFGLCWHVHGPQTNYS